MVARHNDDLSVTRLHSDSEADFGRAATVPSGSRNDWHS